MTQLQSVVVLTVFLCGSAINGQLFNPAPPRCEGGVPAYLLIPNQRIVDSSATVYRGVSEAGCLDICTFQKDPNAKTIICATVVYDQPEKQCIISEKSSKPDGTMDLVKNNGAMYYEKVCLPKTINPSCKQAVFQRYPQVIIAGFAEKAVPAHNFSACVQACAESLTCKSALYYYEDAECVLNTDRAFNRPKSFIMEKKDKVEYFDNGCLLESKTTLGRIVRAHESGATEVNDTAAAVSKQDENVTQHPVVEESSEGNVTSWSQFFPCDKHSGYKIRTRTCKVFKCGVRLAEAVPCSQKEKTPVTELKETDWSDWSNVCQQLPNSESCIGIQTRSCKGTLSNCQGPKTRYCFPTFCAQEKK